MNNVIQSKRFDGRTMTLVHVKTSKAVIQGEKVTDFRGDKAVVVGGRAPHKFGSVGKVWVMEDESERECYPTCFDLAWVPSGKAVRS